MIRESQTLKQPTVSGLFSTCKDAQRTDWFEEGTGHSMMLDAMRRYCFQDPRLDYVLRMMYLHISRRYLIMDHGCVSCKV